MPKMVKIADLTLEDGFMPMPLRITHRQERVIREYVGGGKRVQSARIRVKCGCCDQALEIFPADRGAVCANADTIEINGVLATIAQWRQVLLPMLGVAMPESAEIVRYPSAVLDPLLSSE